MPCGRSTGLLPQRLRPAADQLRQVMLEQLLEIRRLLEAMDRTPCRPDSRPNGSGTPRAHPSAVCDRGSARLRCRPAGGPSSCKRAVPACCPSVPSRPRHHRARTPSLKRTGCHRAAECWEADASQNDTRAARRRRPLRTDGIARRSGPGTLPWRGAARAPRGTARYGRRAPTRSPGARSHAARGRALRQHRPARIRKCGLLRWPRRAWVRDKATTASPCFNLRAGAGAASGRRCPGRAGLQSGRGPAHVRLGGRHGSALRMRPSGRLPLQQARAQPRLSPCSRRISASRSVRFIALRNLQPASGDPRNGWPPAPRRRTARRAARPSSQDSRAGGQHVVVGNQPPDGVLTGV